jgi:hypothetical protein
MMVRGSTPWAASMRAASSKGWRDASTSTVPSLSTAVKCPRAPAVIVMAIRVTRHACVGRSGRVFGQRAEVELLFVSAAATRPDF